MTGGLLFALWTYLVAAMPFGVIVTTLAGGAVDIRTAGSGNIGATNVARLYGWGLALGVLLLDMAKGAAPILVAQWLWPDASLWWIGTVALTAFLGHCFPVYLDFRGGKGVATAGGIMMALSPAPTLLALAAWSLTIATTGKSSLSSLTAAVALIMGALLLDMAIVPLVMVLSLAVTATHIANIRRLMRGEESPVVRSVRYNRTSPQSARDALDQGPGGNANPPPAW